MSGKFREVVFDRDALERFSQARPFHRWLGMKVTRADAYGIALTIEWREELLSNPDVRSVHGGILATLIDTAAAFAVTVYAGHTVPTIDLRVDYHKMAAEGRLRATGRLVKFGRTIAVADAEIHDVNDALVASGRGVYFTRAG